MRDASAEPWSEASRRRRPASSAARHAATAASGAVLIADSSSVDSIGRLRRRRLRRRSSPSSARHSRGRRDGAACRSPCCRFARSSARRACAGSSAIPAASFAGRADGIERRSSVTMSLQRRSPAATWRLSSARIEQLERRADRERPVGLDRGDQRRRAVAEPRHRDRCLAGQGAESRRSPPRGCRRAGRRR